MSSDRITRHRLSDRIFHWAMAASMLALVGTGLCPILGIEFEWIEIHWIAGLVLTVVIVWHIFRAVFQQDLMSMWLGPVELIKTMAAVLKGHEPKPGKYSVAQRLMHHTVTVLSLAALVTGLLLMFRIDQPLWGARPLRAGAIHVGLGLRYSWLCRSGVCRRDPFAHLFRPAAREAVLYTLDDPRLDHPKRIEGQS